MDDGPKTKVSYRCRQSDAGHPNLSPSAVPIELLDVIRTMKEGRVSRLD
jgi:hypothetical protein